MKRKNMEISEFLEVMEANKGIWKEYDELPEEQKRFLAHVNICTGVAETYYDDDGELFGVGGIRFVGLGEAWLITLPNKRKPYLLRTAAENFKRIRDSKNLWRIFAESKVSEHFLQHLGFKKQDGMHIYTRT